MRKIKVTKSMPAADPEKPKTGVIRYEEGKTYDMPDEMGEIFVREKWGTEVGPGGPNAPKLPAPADVQSFLKVSPETIKLGQKALLSWNAPRGAGWSIDNGIGNVDRVGECEVAPAVTTNYSLVVIDTDGQRETAAVTLTVIREKA
jgi:hypothetical protein